MTEIQGWHLEEVTGLIEHPVQNSKVCLSNALSDLF
jgi:hypothetical protein